MTTTYFNPIQPQTHITDNTIETLRIQLEHSKAQQKRYQIELEALQSIRSKISLSLEDLSRGYRKQIKALESRLKKLENQNHKLKKQNELYEMEVRDFEKRILQKDSIISSILGKDLFVPMKPVASWDNGKENSKNTVDLVGLEKGQSESRTKANKVLNVEKVESVNEETKDIVKAEISPQFKNSRAKVSPNKNMERDIEFFAKEIDQKKLQSSQTKYNEEKLQNSREQKEETVYQRDEIQSQIENKSHVGLNQKSLSVPTDFSPNKTFHQQISPVEKHELPVKQQALKIEEQIPQIEEATPKFNSVPFEVTYEDPDIPLSVNKFKPAPPPKKKLPASTTRNPIKQPVKKTKPLPKYTNTRAFTSQPIDQELKDQQNYQIPQNKEETQGQILFQQKQKQANTQNRQKEQNNLDFIEEAKKLESHVFKETYQQKIGEETFTHEPNFIKGQEVKRVEEQDNFEHNISRGSIARSKKSKRQKPRPVEQKLINFEEEIVPITQMSSNSSLNFFDSLANRNQSQSQVGGGHENEMHGLVDESSIEQIDNRSMFSNPMFGEENEFERENEEQNKKRKRSNDEVGAVMSEIDVSNEIGMNKEIGMSNEIRLGNEVVFSRHGVSKKMSKKKGKREAVEVMDPASFV